eukprot:Sspe_Gene.91463::Locus_62971_Transcript_1_1_Confidence_1.000_Length_1187::g.91463::m.91463
MPHPTLANGSPCNGGGADVEQLTSSITRLCKSIECLLVFGIVYVIFDMRQHLGVFLSSLSAVVSDAYSNIAFSPEALLITAAALAVLVYLQQQLRGLKVELAALQARDRSTQREAAAAARPKLRLSRFVADQVSRVHSSRMSDASSFAPSRVAVDTLQEWLGKMNGNMWSPVHYVDRTGDATMSEDPNAPVPTVMVRTRVKVPADYFAKFVLSTTEADTRLKKELDPTLQEIRVVRSIADGESIGYTRIGLPWPLVAREMLYRMKRHNLPDGAIAIIVESEEHDEVPTRSDVVRANIRTFYHITPERNQCKVVFVACMDPKGSIPHTILHLFKTKTASYFCHMRDELVKRRERGE